MKLREPSEIIINGVTLEKILEDHKKWLLREGGERADLSGADLNYADLDGVNLSNAKLNDTDLDGVNLSNASLISADLRCVNLFNADLSNADLIHTDLRYANLFDANLFNADLSNANLRYANLSYADLSNANLSNANLNYADLRDVDLSGAKITKIDINKVKYNHLTSFIALQCPEEGSFIGYKKANNKIVKLLILEDSKRSSATSRKCRCDKAKVLSIESLDGKEKYTEAISSFDSNFIYRVGEIVKVDDFCEDRWKECAAGIHFFITRQEAINY